MTVGRALGKATDEIELDWAGVAIVSGVSMVDPSIARTSVGHRKRGLRFGLEARGVPTLLAFFAFRSARNAS